MSMSSLSLESDQHEAGLFEYVVKMSHTDRSQMTSSHVLPVRFRTCVHPLTDLPLAANTALVATPGVLEESEGTRKPPEGDVPPVIFRPVKQPEPQTLADDDTVPKEPAASAADPAVPSEAPPEPTRDVTVQELVTEVEPARQTEGGESQPGEPRRKPTHHHSHKEKKHKKKKKDKSDKKREIDRDGQSENGRKQRYPSGDVDGSIGRNMRAAQMHPDMLVEGSTTATSEEEKYQHQNMDKKHKKKKKDKSDKKREIDIYGQSKKGRKQRYPSGDVDGAIGRNMRAAQMHPDMLADGSTTATPEEEKYQHQNMILQERLRLARRRQQQQQQMQMALQEMLTKTYLKQEICVKDGRRRDSALVQQLLDGSFPLARTTIGARRYSMAQSISEPTESVRTQDT